MHKSKKATASTIWIAMTILLFLVFAFLVIGGIFGGLRFFSIADQETQLKQEYRTFWSDGTDGQINPSCSEITNKAEWDMKTRPGGNIPKCYIGTYDNLRPYYYEDENFICSSANGGSVSSNGMIKLKKIHCETKRKFSGQEVVLLVSAEGYADAAGDTGGGCSFIPNINVDCQITPNSPINCQKHVIRIVPNSFDVGTYSIYKDNYQLAETELGEFSVKFTCTSGSGTGNYVGLVDYIGYKAQFGCDLVDDEVWVSESFDAPVVIGDLSFIPVKFCHEERPFTLRRLGEGEKVIRPEEGIYPLNRGELIGESMMNGDIITINYAAKNLPGTTNKCASDEVNVNTDGDWICKKVIGDSTMTERPIEKRIIKSQLSGLTFSFDASQVNRGFKIGDKEFIVSSFNFLCDHPAEGTYYDPPMPNSDCYTSTVQYGKVKEVMEDGEIWRASSNLQVEYYADGRYYHDTNALTGIYNFELIDPFVVDASYDDGLRISYKNNMPSNIITAKVVHRSLRTDELIEERLINLKAVQGDNVYNIPVNDDNLGINELSVQIYYPITTTKEILIPSDEVILQYDVSKDDATMKSVIVVEDDVVLSSGVVDRKTLLQRFIEFISSFIATFL